MAVAERSRKNLHPQRGPVIRVPAITPQLAHKVAEKLAKGLPLRLALAAVAPCPIPVNHWNAMLSKHKRVARAFEQKLAECIEAVLDRIAVVEKGWQRDAWLLERRFPADFCQPKAGQGRDVNVSVTVNGIEMTLLKRAREMARKSNSKVIDVQSASEVIPAKQLPETTESESGNGGS